jgi:GTP-binding protein LepA
VVILVRVIDGVINKGLNVKFMAGGTEHLIDRGGCFTPKREELAELGPGEIGFITARSRKSNWPRSVTRSPRSRAARPRPARL